MDRRDAIKLAITSLFGIVLALPRTCKANRRDNVQTVPTRILRTRFEKGKDGYDVIVSEQATINLADTGLAGFPKFHRVSWETRYYGVEPYYLVTYTDRPRIARVCGHVDGDGYYVMQREQTSKNEKPPVVNGFPGMRLSSCERKLSGSGGLPGGNQYYLVTYTNRPKPDNRKESK